MLRLFARLRAYAGGYFWLPCPVCHEYFGGHEWRSYDGLSPYVPDLDRLPSGGEGICPRCTRAGYGYPNDEWPGVAATTKRPSRLATERVGGGVRALGPLPSDKCKRSGCSHWLWNHNEQGCLDCECLGFMPTPITDAR